MYFVALHMWFWKLRIFLERRGRRGPTLIAQAFGPRGSGDYTAAESGVQGFNHEEAALKPRFGAEVVEDQSYKHERLKVFAM